MGLIPIYLHLRKLSDRAQLRAHLLSHNHILYLLIESRPSNYYNSHYLFLNSLSSYQRKIIKGSIIDMDNRFNEVFPLFDTLNKEFSPGSHIIDIFPGYFSFHPYNKHSNVNLKFCTCQLNNLAIASSLDHLCTLVVTNASIKNNVVTSITHIHICNKPVIKTLHHTVNITSIETELFSIRCGINQATNIPGIFKIIIITDFIYITRRIFDSSPHPFQMKSRNFSSSVPTT